MASGAPEPRGEIPGKRLTPGEWVMSDADIDNWINAREMLAPVEAPHPSEVVADCADGLSERAHRRLLG